MVMVIDVRKVSATGYKRRLFLILLAKARLSGLPTSRHD